MTQVLPNKTSSVEFQARYPGPYFYQASSDGVDDTFEVFCQTSGRHIASTYYWMDRRPCELVTYVVCTVLNTHRIQSSGDAGQKVHQPSERELQMFCGMHRPPFITRPIDCDYRGSGCEVFSTGNESGVITVYETHAALIADQIADALNTLFASLRPSYNFVNGEWL